MKLNNGQLSPVSCKSQGHIRASWLSPHSPWQRRGFPEWQHELCADLSLPKFAACPSAEAGGQELAVYAWCHLPSSELLFIHHTPLIDTTPDVYTLILSGRFYAFLNRYIKSCRQGCEVFNDEWVRIQIWCILFACSDIGFSFHLELRSWIVLQLVFSSSVHVTFWTQLEFWYLFW